MAPATTSNSFQMVRPSPPRRPSRFELILSFCGNRLTALFLSDIPEHVAAFSRPAPTIFRATFNAFELVETIVFLLELAGSRMFLGKKGMSLRKVLLTKSGGGMTGENKSHKFLHCPHLNLKNLLAGNE